MFFFTVIILEFHGFFIVVGAKIGVLEITVMISIVSGRVFIFSISLMVRRSLPIVFVTEFGDKVVRLVGSIVMNFMLFGLVDVTTFVQVSAICFFPWNKQVGA